MRRPAGSCGARGTIPKPGEPGDETWGDIPYEKRWHVGMWMVPSFDPELNRIYVGTSVTAPAPKYMLGGNGEQHLYHNSTLALDADTGEIVWYFQHVVDHWDLDHPFERLLVDTAVAPDPASVKWINPRVRSGERRKVITGVPGKTGIVYTLDRETGDFLWARETTMQNVIADINVESGAATVNPEKIFTAPGQEKLICPSTSGGKNYPAGTYSPLTGIMYYPLQNTCMVATSANEIVDTDVTYALRNRVQITPGTDNVGDDRGDLGRDRRDGLEARAARRSSVADVDGRRPAVRRRRERPLPGVRPAHRRGALGGEPRRAGQRLPRHVRGQRQTVRRRQHGRLGPRARPRELDAGAAARPPQSAVRVRTAMN